MRNAHAPVPNPTRSMNQIRDTVLSFMNPDTIPFLNKTHFEYSFVKDNYPYENIYVYITLIERGPIILFSIHIFIQYGIICSFAPFPTFIHYGIISRFKYQKHLQTFIRVQFSQHSFDTKSIKKRSWGFIFAWSELYFYSVRLLMMTLHLHGVCF